MMSFKEGVEAVRFARNVVDSVVKQELLPEVELSGTFQQKKGVFVTLLTFPQKNLRGCIGIPEPVMKLQDAIREAASSATRDPRFPPVDQKELDYIIVEVTLLTKPELINVKNPKEYLSQIVVGRDGLIAEKGFFRGLLLPQVPVEYNWEVEEFLSQTCMKAGLPPDAWFEKDTKIYKFSGQIFAEKEPYGEVEERRIDGKSC
ncbi:MAG TPA: TIGR00296 family protein [Thermoplasmatales archaeon]|nr:TIGR00296 family protein [Thermoplasmatales archaeon]